MVLGQLNIHMQKNDVKTFMPQHIKKNLSKWIKDLNYKILRKNRHLCDLGLGNSFPDMISNAQATKEKIN